MSGRERHPAAGADHAMLHERMRGVGLMLLSCTVSGDAMSIPPRGQDWFADLVCRAPMFLQALKRHARSWSEHEPCPTVEALPGIWIAPMAIVSRRRTVGYSVVVIPGRRILESEMLEPMCRSAGLDVQLCRSLLSELPPVADEDVPRLVDIVDMAREDQMRLSMNNQAMESVGQQLSESYEEINLLYTIIRNMTVARKPSEFVRIACAELRETLPYAWIGMLFMDDPHRLRKLAGRFIFDGRMQCSAAEACSLATTLFTQAEPDVPIVIDPAVNPEHERYTAFGQASLVHPITNDQSVVGLLVAGDKQGDDRAASSVDIKLLGAAASHTAIFVENASLYEDLNATFLGTLEALTASIDAKDRYTRGHSQRVAALTQSLALAVGLDEHAVARTHIAGLVHDVGKIGVPERVLLKPGRLNDEEFGWIRRHPEMGGRILKDIPQLRDILPGVLHHHERWDGNGYPAGLADDEIPFVARLITLADSFDAMSSSRTYRSQMSRPEALAEIRRCAGTQFDPELANVFVSLNFDEFDRLVAEHQAEDRQSFADSVGEDAA